MNTKGKLSQTARVLLAAVGLLSLLAGIVGIFVPVWPTTCFLLLSTACFSRSSDRLYRWMTANSWFGGHVRRYRETGSIDGRVRNLSLVSLWLSLLLSIALVKSSVWLVVALLAIGIAVSVHLLNLPVQKPMAPVR
jgi:uncharacterized membrane protein YbaN (DUF454 family)